MALWNRKRGKPRRVDRVRPEGDVPWHQRIRTRRNLMQLAILLGFFAAAVLIVQLPRQPLPWRVGDKITQPIFARADFESVDREATLKARDLMALRVPGIYEPRVSGVVELRQGLTQLLEAVAEAPSAEELPEDIRTTWPVEKHFAAAKKALGEEAANLEALKQTLRAAVSELARPLVLPVLPDEAFQSESARLQDLKEVEKGLPPSVPPEIVMGPPEGSAAISIVTTDAGDQLKRLPLEQVLRQAERNEIRARLIQLLGEPLTQIFGAGGVEAMAEPMARLLGPTLSYAEAATKNRRKEAAEKVQDIRRRHKRGTTLIDASPVEPTTLTESHRRLLEQAHEAYRARLGLFRRGLAWVGVAAVIGLITFLAGLYTYHLHLSVARSVPRTFVLCALALVVLGGSKAVAHTGWSFAIWTFFLATAAMILSTAYNERFALAVAGAMGLLVAIAVRSGFDWVVTAGVGTSVAILSVGEINNRSKLIRVGALAGAGFLLASAGLAVWRLELDADTWPHHAQVALLYFASGLFAGVVMLGILPFIERAFGIVTNISLLELCDVNQPALRRLAIEAPGTYQHSLLIGTLAEAAAEAIGANGLLARVGAYFHDIGKVNKPRYYVENWQREDSTHEDLTPQMSRLIITSHVKDGLEMADRLGLPPVIKRFITEHHGTTLVEYFYREAERQRAAGRGEAPAEEDYRYPGPKPQSPETAIVMLSDTCEGATRSLKEPTAAKIGATVHEMIMKRLLDGQLDECDLRLSDLHTIEETLTKTLLSVYHGRIPYPTGHEAPPAEEEEEEEQTEGEAPGRSEGDATGEEEEAREPENEDA